MFQGEGSKSADQPIAVLAATAEPAFAFDSNGRIVAWNPAAEKLLGYAAHKVLAKNCSDVLCGRDVSGHTYCNEFCSVRRAIARNESVHAFEMDIRTAAGKLVHVATSTLVVRCRRASQRIIIHLLRPTMRVDDAEHEVIRDRPTPVKAVPAAFDTRAAANGFPTMTARQIEVLRSLAKGHSSKAVANDLGISPLTVRTHTRNILRDCGVHSVLQAVLRAQSCGLI